MADVSREILDRCHYVLENIGPDARVLLLVSRKRSPRSYDRVRVWPSGPYGRIVGPHEHSPGVWLVDVRARDVLDAAKGGGGV